MYNKIFGIGLPKTGTKSASEYLKLLGINSIHNPVDEITFNQLRLGDFDLQILKTHDAIFDLPSACFYKDYDYVFPNSKFILTTREKEGWLSSCEYWWNDILKLTSIESITNFSNQNGNKLVFFKANMFGCIAFNRRVFSRIYDEWHQEVFSYFLGRSDDLCVLELSSNDKQQTLCDFLGKLPTNCGYPHCNNITEHIQNMKKIEE